MLRIWAPCCGIEGWAAQYESIDWMKGKEWDWINDRPRRVYYPIAGPYKWRQWHKGGQLKSRYEESKFRPSLVPRWTVTNALPKCKERS